MSDTDNKTPWKVTTEPPYTVTDPSGVVVLKVHTIKDLMEQVAFMLEGNRKTPDREALVEKLTRIIQLHIEHEGWKECNYAPTMYNLAVKIVDALPSESTRIAHLTAERDRLESCANCKQPIPKDEVFRCTDCKLPFHRKCAVDHFVTDAVVMGIRTGGGDTVPPWLIEALSPAHPPAAPAEPRYESYAIVNQGKLVKVPNIEPTPAKPPGEAERFEVYFKERIETGGFHIPPIRKQLYKDVWLAATADHAERVAKVREAVVDLSLIGVDEQGCEHVDRAAVLELIDAAFPAADAQGVKPGKCRQCDNDPCVCGLLSPPSQLTKGGQR